MLFSCDGRGKLSLELKPSLIFKCGKIQLKQKANPAQIEQNHRTNCHLHLIVDAFLGKKIIFSER